MLLQKIPLVKYNWLCGESQFPLQCFNNPNNLFVSFCFQLQPSGPAALQKSGAAPREAAVRHRGDGGIRAGVTHRAETKPQNNFC